MKYIIITILLIAANVAQSKTVAPTPLYTITTPTSENTFYLTAAISKMVTSINKELYSKGLPSFICGFTGGEVGRVFIISILNDKHKGKSITFDQAIKSSIKGLSEGYPC